MDAVHVNIRRATVDDLPQLIELWKQEQLPWQTLEKRFTEFQVAVDGEGKIWGAIGIRIARHQGQLHSEVFRQWDLADTLRERFWERIETLSHNHSLTMLWTQMTAPFWHGYGFHPPTAETLERFPPEFGDQGGTWTVLSLRPELLQTVDLEMEFDRFAHAERQRTEAAMEQARWLKRLATILAVLLFLGVLVGMSYLLMRSSGGR
ncbi:hypothetical protein NXS98_01065 [Fontisphaera persica]|uniref:hypothetical protein n=1 Tax=Fontisphaera persica TaxID=2974023 RepID=UPI0024BFA6A0|nr:hypothetical protein [Fontisphaera persica]WCJ59736.1 hypothetical protein NXS98_01065 [Fontisphaera persica]